MIRNRAVILAVVCAIIGAFFISPSPAQAQTYTWCYAWDFTTSNPIGSSGWYDGSGGTTNSYSAGNGWYFASSYSNAARIDIDFSPTITVTYAGLSYSIPNNSDFGFDNEGMYAYNPSQQTIGNTPNIGAAGTYTRAYTATYSGVSKVMAFISPASSVVYIRTVELRGTGTSPSFTGGTNCMPSTATPTHTPTPTRSPTPTNTPIPPTATPLPGTGWSKPIRFGDAVSDSFNVYNAQAPFTKLVATNYAINLNANIQFSKQPGASVFAVWPGTVTAVDSLGAACYNQTDLNFSIANAFCVLRQTDEPNAFYPAVGPLQSSLRALMVLNGSIVTVSLSDGRKTRYLIAQPTVKVGDSVQQGCELGLTLETKWVKLTGAYVEIMQDRESQGYTIVQGIEDTASFNLKPLLTAEPEGKRCTTNATGDPRCTLVQNPTFFSNGYPSLDGWNGASDSDLQLNGGLLLTDYVTQALNLNPAVQYTIRIDFEKRAGQTVQFKVALGAGDPQTVFSFGDTTKDSATFGPSTFTQNYSVDSANIFAFTLQRDKTYDAPVIKFLCVTEQNATPPQPAGGCLVRNPEFEGQWPDTYWTLSPNPLGVDISYSQGIAFVPQGVGVEQYVRLSPKDGSTSQTYSLSVVARRDGSPSPGSYVNFGWILGSSSGTSANLSDQNWRTLNLGTVTISSAALTQVRITVGGSGGQSAQIDKICITTTDGVSPPGYLQGPEIIAACRTCSYIPTGVLAEDFTEYVRYLSCALGQLWECNLKSVLAGIWLGITAILTLFSYFRIWLGGTISGAMEWWLNALYAIMAYANGLTLNLGTQINNGLTNVRFGTVITQGGAGLWDVLLAVINQIGNLGNNIVTGLRDVILSAIGPVTTLLSQIVSGLFGLLSGIVALIAALISLAASFIVLAGTTLVGTASDSIGALFAAFNAAAMAQPPGAFSCNVPGSFLYYPCLGLYILDNTIFAGPAQVLIPLVLGVIAINLLLWGLKKIRVAFGGA